jgi:hypothetical protein
MPMSSPDLLSPEDNGDPALPPLMPPDPGELQRRLACINASTRGTTSNSSDVTQFTHDTYAQHMDNQRFGHRTQIRVDDPRPHLFAGSTRQGGDHPQANLTAMAGSNYFQALGSNDELDWMPRRINGTPTPMTHINRPDNAHPQWETFTTAVGATPLDENNNLTACGICGLLREQARAANTALADFRFEVWDLAWANEVRLDKNHRTVATLQSQLEQVLGGLANLTSIVQWHDSRFETLDNSAGAAALPEVIQRVEMVVTGRLDDISGAVVQIGRDVLGAIDQIGRKVRALQSASGLTTHPPPGSGPTGTTEPFATGDPSGFRPMSVNTHIPPRPDPRDTTAPPLQAPGHPAPVLTPDGTLHQPVNDEQGATLHDRHPLFPWVDVTTFNPNPARHPTGPATSTRGGFGFVPPGRSPYRQDQPPCNPYMQQQPAPAYDQPAPTAPAYGRPAPPESPRDTYTDRYCPGRSAFSCYFLKL